MKPASQTIKDYIIGNMVEELSYSKDVIDSVIAFQGEDMLNAVKQHSELEISGFGLLYVSQVKLKNRIGATEGARKKMQLQLEASSPEDLELNTKKMDYYNTKVEFLKSKLKCQS